MGLSIHYSGYIKNTSLIEELMTEVTDICHSLAWTSQLIREPNSDSINGILFAPEGCEPIFLTFLPNGRMCSPVNLMNRDIYEDNELDKELLYTTSTKTQFAGPDAHIAVIKLLRYMKEKYFSRFDLTDEGEYWETGDEKVLLARFAKYNFLLDAVSAALSELTTTPGETPVSLADKIEEMLKKKFGGEQ
jgi:hypothetical protein